MSDRPSIQHAEGRPATFKLHFLFGACKVELASEAARIKEEETILVREVLPGEITLTRDELRMVLLTAETKHEPFSSGHIETILAELFPSEGQEVGG